jgi:plastocyanin
MSRIFPGNTAVRTLFAAAVISVACLLQTAVAVAAPTTHTIVIAGMKFAPEALIVKSGDTVVWVNQDFFPHTATAQNRTFDSRDIEATKYWKYVAKETGRFPYICTLHPTMTGTLIVK